MTIEARLAEPSSRTERGERVASRFQRLLVAVQSQDLEVRQRLEQPAGVPSTSHRAVDDRSGRHRCEELGDLLDQYRLMSEVGFTCHDPRSVIHATTRSSVAP